jgi:hypothetical protein
LYGMAALVVGAILVLIVVLRHRRRTNASEPPAETVTLTTGTLTTGRRPAPTEPWSSSNDL